MPCAGLAALTPEERDGLVGDAAWLGEDGGVEVAPDWTDALPELTGDGGEGARVFREAEAAHATWLMREIAGSG